MRVLIVDDHPGFRARARALLESGGFDVVGEADDGESGVLAAARLSPQLVLLDVQLPGIDGFATARQITSAGGEVQVVLTSSRDGAELERQVEQSGARGFIPKGELSCARLAALLR